ncbi:MAG: BCAM0308 family protein [Candidatus Binatia bacterium]|nr:BCAM0308 family protein [Candidatus Binatia bacterium]
MSTKPRGRGNIHTRRNLAEFDANDPYAPRIDPGEVAVCGQCHALYQRRHWFFDAEAYFRETMQPTTRIVICPACQKIRDRYAEGQVTLRASPFLTAHKEEILHLLRNEEERAKGINPLERIIEITESEDGIIVTTTNEKLAQRLGRTLKSTYQGETTYHWSEPKFLSVTWHRGEPSGKESR